MAAQNIIRQIGEYQPNPALRNPFNRHRWWHDRWLALSPDDWKGRCSLIREVYMTVNYLLIEQSTKGQGQVVNPYFLPWDFTPIETNAWGEIRRHGLPLYPQYPILHYFADFADPYRKIAIELDGRAWHSEAKDAARDADMIALGWVVYRIPGLVANTWLEQLVEQEGDARPVWLADDGGFEQSYDEDSYYLGQFKHWRAQAELRSLDGFFNKLAREIYGRASGMDISDDYPEVQ